jgi:hypothetical protein
MIELMAQGGIRMGEVLKLRTRDLQDRKWVLRENNSGRDYEFVFIPQIVADRLGEYVLQVCDGPNDRIFLIITELGELDSKKQNIQGVNFRKNTTCWCATKAQITNG